MKYRNLLGVLLACLVSGCTTADIKGVVDALNSPARPVGTSPGQPAVQPSANMEKNSLLKTPLYNALHQNLYTGGKVPEWPKVVILDLEIPRNELAAPSINPLPGECIRFDAVLWHDAKRSERFSHVTLCASELPTGVTYDFVGFLSFISGKTTGQLRTDGPTPPLYIMPTDQAMKQWTAFSGLYFVGGLMRLVGYDPDFPIDNRRFWIRNIKYPK